MRHSLVIAAFLAPFAAHAATPTEVASRAGANLQRPRWSVDGSKLAYEANYHEKKVVETWVGDPATRAFTQVTAGARAPSAATSGFATANKGGTVVYELCWAPPAVGRYLYSASNDVGEFDLYISGGGPVAAAPGADGGASWSPDGRWVAFTSARTGAGDLYLLDTAAIEQAPRRISSAAGSSELYPTWSADSTRIVYVGHSPTGDNLWLKPALDANPTQITSWRGNQIRPRFAPAGTQIAFYANHEDLDRFDLYVMDAAPGATPKLLVKGIVPDISGPSWTPDGSRILYVKDDDERYDPIAAVQVATGTSANLAIDTVGHGDLDVVKRADGKVWLSYVAQGRKSDPKRDFDRLYVVALDAVP